MSNRMLDRTSEYISGGMPDRMPEYMSDRMPERIPKYVPNTMSEYIIYICSNIRPDMSWWGSLEIKYFLFLQVCAWGCGFSIQFVARHASATTIETDSLHVPGDLCFEFSKQSGLTWKRSCFLRRLWGVQFVEAPAVIWNSCFQPSVLADLSCVLWGAAKKKTVWRLARTAKLSSGDFFWLQHFPSNSGCGDSRVCSVSWLQLTLLTFGKPWRPPSMTGGSGSVCSWTRTHRFFSLVLFMLVIDMHFVERHLYSYMHLYLFTFVCL